MKLTLKHPKVIKSPNIDGEPGSFSLEIPVLFEKCRERFAASFEPEISGFYFMHEPNQLENIASFILKTEEILEIDQNSQFSNTNKKNVLHIEPSPFWINCALKRSLLTVLLRCGMVYSSEVDNYEEALFSQLHIRNTKNAVMRFLFGFTEYVGPSISLPYHTTVQAKGWVSVFENKERFYVREALVLPNKKKSAVTTNIGDVLWC